MDSPSQAGLAPANAAFYRSTVMLLLIVAAALLGFFFSNPAASPTGELVASNHHRCVVAQSDLHTLELGSRVYIVDEDGQRSFRADADRPVAIELAKARITRYCRQG